MSELNWRHNAADSLSAADLNRIEAHTKALSGILLGYGYSARVTPYATQDVITTTTTERVNRRYDATGAEQIFTAQHTGEYTIVAAGAAGAGGNVYGTAYAPRGGKGARLTAHIHLDAGDTLRIIVGGKGACTQATAKDGTSGGGGGCTMVLRNIAAITDSRYQFTKSTPFEALLVAAGGGGGNDSAYQSNAVDGADGEGAFKSPANYTAASTVTGTATTSAVMGVQQYITNNAAGAVYSRNSGTAQGGFGCGGAADDSQAYGGGWCNGAAAFSAASWSLDENAIGESGVNDADGYVTLETTIETTTTEIVPRDYWTRTDFLTPAELARIRRNINALQHGFYRLPDWRELVQKFCEDGRETLDAEQVNAKEWDLHSLYVWVDRMAAAFLYAGEIYAGEDW